MGTEKDVLQEAYHTHSQQLAELKNLVLQYIEVDDDFSFKFDDIRDLLENHLKNSKKPVLDFKNKDEFGDAYTEFYMTKVLS